MTVPESGQRPRILIVEDETKIALVVRDYLEHEGFDVTHVGDGTGAVERVATLEPALVILDLMLPGESGLDICRELREHSSVPVIKLTARVDDEDRLEGFRVGADDYVCKPFNPHELVARVRAVLRRAGVVDDAASKEAEDRITHRDVILDLVNFVCSVHSEPLELTPIEFRMLREMLSRPGSAFTRYQLMRVIYEDHRVVSDRTIDSHISHLRSKLSERFGDEELVRSVYGVGYRID